MNDGLVVRTQPSRFADTLGSSGELSWLCGLITIPLFISSGFRDI